MTVIHALHHHDDRLLGYLNNEGEKLFWDDLHVHEISGENSYSFYMPANIPEAEFFSERGRLLIPSEDRGYEEFIIYNAATYMKNEKVVRAVATYTDLNALKTLNPTTYQSYTLRQYANAALVDTGWQVGEIQYEGIRTKTFNQPLGAYSFLVQVANEFDVELRFRVETSGNRITGRYVDFIKRIGRDNGKEIVLGKDLVDIEKVVHSDRVVTALDCYGPERDDGTRLITTVTDAGAFQAWNWKKKHIRDRYEPQSDRQEMTLEELRQYGTTELKKRIASVTDYFITGADLESIFPHEATRLGDRLGIKNPDFSPPLYAHARVIRVERSIVDKASKVYKIGEVVTYTEDEVFQTFRQLQDLYAIKVIKSNSAPPGRIGTLWIDTSGTVDVPHTWNSTTAVWDKYSPTQAADIGAETPAGAQVKADQAKAAADAYTNQQLINYVDKTLYNQELADIQGQIDGSITTWFYPYVPTLENLPASDWTTNELKNQHLGDLFYDDSTGYGYRFKLNADVYQWKRIEDTDVTKALADAQRAQDTADGKRRVFVNQPIPPYEVGDLWSQGVNGDLMRCSVSRSTGVYNAADWVLASKYTDDTRAVEAENNAKEHANLVSGQAYQDAVADARVYVDQNGVLQGSTYNGVSISNTDGFVTVRGDQLVRTVQNSTVGIVIQRRATVNDPWINMFYVDAQTGNLKLAGDLDGAGGTFRGRVEVQAGENKTVIENGIVRQEYASTDGLYTYLIQIKDHIIELTSADPGGTSRSFFNEQRVFLSRTDNVEGESSVVYEANNVNGQLHGTARSTNEFYIDPKGHHEVFLFDVDAADPFHRSMSTGTVRLKFLNGTAAQLQVRKADDSAYAPIASSDFVTASRREYKKNIQSMECKGYNATERLKLLIPSFYHLNGDLDSEPLRAGFILDEAVWEIVDPSGEGLISMQAVALLVKGFQEQQTIIEQQQLAINDLIKRVETLEKGGTA
ncbi:phage tail spike protein [Jeotgalibacillus soli]|uniref:Tail spike domain-containing protein n=1 Tax=Jeotgalibacillus soli TaxID=889306 RepID=A0A0C2VP34_9BACL|nr:phage tail spike protein [Jeotgalibacillus soli]KIL45768.1 hypothetical protein KP78_21170 [Jeotgalibacillus soli]